LNVMPPNTHSLRINAPQKRIFNKKIAEEDV